MNRRDLILTIMQGYDYPFVEPFFQSLTQVNFAGDLIVFVSGDLSAATIRKLKTSGAKLIPFKSAFPFIGEYATAFKGISPQISINNFRFIFYEEFLKQHPHEYDRVMLTDIRDVVFQREPFSIIKEPGICFFLEDRAQTFRHQFNYDWLANATDMVTADSLADEQVSCAGITIGDTAAMLQYLAYMTGKLAERETLDWGLDQGIHNSYIYVGKPPGRNVFGSETAYVINLGAYQPYQLNTKGEVVNASGDPYAIVHQYDRSGKLFGSVKRKYIGSRLTQRLKRLYYLVMP